MNRRRKMRLAAPFVITLGVLPACGGDNFHPNPPEPVHPNPPGPQPTATPEASGTPTVEPPFANPPPPKPNR